MWPGIPEGRGSTCVEEGCGEKRRARGDECRACYRRKWMAHRRATGELSDGRGGYEVGFTPGVIQEIDLASFNDWQREQDSLS